MNAKSGMIKIWGAFAVYIFLFALVASQGLNISGGSKRTSPSISANIG